MAEALAAIAVIASVAQLADYGFKLSVKLFAYSEAVYKADKTIRSFSNEVSLTSAVLKELAGILSSKESQYVSVRAIEATQSTVKDCFEVFDQLNTILEKSMGSGVQNDNTTTSSAGIAKLGTLDRLKWPFLQPKVDLLRSNLDRLKASLTLMLQVLSFARDIAKQTNQDSASALQKQMIESLAKSEKEAAQRYQQMLLLLQQPPSSTDETAGSRDPAAITGEAPPPYINTHVVNTQDSASQATGQPSLPAKLPLCFELILDVLRENGRQMSSTRSDEQSMRHIELQRTISTAQHLEARDMTKLFGDAAQTIFANAPKDQAELRQTLDHIAIKYSPLLKQQVATNAQSSSAAADVQYRRRPNANPPVVSHSNPNEQPGKYTYRTRIQPSGGTRRTSNRRTATDDQHATPAGSYLSSWGAKPADTLDTNELKHREERMYAEISEKREKQQQQRQRKDEHGNMNDTEPATQSTEATTYADVELIAGSRVVHDLLIWDEDGDELEPDRADGLETQASADTDADAVYEETDVVGRLLKEWTTVSA